ncbi:Uncharacterized membrane protein [Octadecabacter temperatus]|jgi:uncharacterized membrane protein|uniref:Uncharacterized protein n=1 Tax=Octadecabacter temperatus TaxID=1458307 RepID=A0A0K0Y725_9RHOB|nr:DUF1622 domain-containing protein [Octadecabacter temperatus]AKS46710.1 hypothetical protein OSB_21710 [Octadecabacter temperatus]SIO19738.1 Uncharacterized membrane protein [Octadecabacter temperatus]
MEMPESIFKMLELVTLFVDGVGYAILIFTVFKFVIRYVGFELHRIRGLECAKRFQEIRVEFLSHVILAIDFMVVSDVIESGLVDTRDSLITLGIFVLIRSILAFFLGLDLKDARDEKISEEPVG